jgi:2-polyprenyl-3-methyl-5-hydroxy-6-metoxy-1,4-benzoquinol methylase
MLVPRSLSRTALRNTISANNRLGYGCQNNDNTSSRDVTLDWYDEKNGMHKALHAMNRLRVPWIVDHLPSVTKKQPAVAKEEDFQPFPLKDHRILDVGCGGGILSLALARLGANVVGLDLDHSVTQE